MSDIENGPEQRRKRKVHATLPDKGPSIRPKPQKEEHAFRDGLRTWHIHKAWPDLPVYFRKYRLLIEYSELHKRQNTADDELLTLSVIIEEMLDNLAECMEGTVESTSGETIARVLWTPSFDNTFAKSRYLYTPKPIAKVKMRMTPKSSFSTDHQNSVDYRFSLYLRELEGLLTEGSGPGGVKMGIVNPFGASADMVGWALESPTPGLVAPESSDEEMDEDPSEAKLNVPGGGLKEVDGKYVKKGGKYRGIARITSWFANGPNKKSTHGTGWLVDSKTIATAGHCVYHKSFGFLKSVEVTFGNESGDATSLHGTQAVVHWCYYTIFAGKSDLGFIRLVREIDRSDAKRLPYIPTPRFSPPGGMRLIARGYPKVPERPARMRRSEHVANYNLDETDHYLEYKLNTDKGSSGCPVFNERGKVVGVHVRNGLTKQGAPINKGVIIDEQDNNPVTFVAFLDHQDPSRMRAIDGLFREMSREVMRYTAFH